MKDKIRSLLEERNAVLLAHNYQPPEIIDIADMSGDSLELSIKAADTDADVIVFCGVHFMAETASILSPDKTVLLPRLDAGCPMADMVTSETLKAKMNKLPNIPVVTYVNSTAAVKAISTICCTSANAAEVVNSLDESEVFMVPDRNLAKNTAAHTSKTVHVWEGYCPIHDRLTVENVKEARELHPESVFMAHPECRPDVIELADAVVSTSGMIRYAKTSKHTSFIVGTEVGLLYPLSKAAPEKSFYPAARHMECPDMKKISLNDIVNCLETMKNEVKVSEDIRKSAFTAVKRMIDLSKAK